MKRILLSIVMAVIGLSAFSQSPSRIINLQPAYALSLGGSTTDGVSLSANSLYLNDIELDSLPQYEIGYIDTQTVRYSVDGFGFYVKADSLHSLNVVYSYAVDGQPQGSFDFNGKTGRFKYYPTADEYKSFTVTFSATNGMESVSEAVEFRLMPNTPSEADAFRSLGVLPDAGDYTIIAESSTTKYLNNQERTAYSISISGKDVVFDDNVQNKVWGLNGRKDIYELNIYAERLIIRSALSFPQTNISIYAKELLFEDHDGVTASICTTPNPEETLTDGEGSAGGNAGNISLYIKTFKGNMAKRFILNGAKGQSTNRNGTPGNGGNGGTVRSTIELRSFCDFVRGSGGVRYDVASDGSTDAGPVIGYGDNGQSGAFEQINKPHAYLHPYYISAVMRHANDAFINNYTDCTLQTCREYRSMIDEYINAIPESEASADEGNEESDEEKETAFGLHDNLMEIGNMLFKLEQGLDYFGNPAGWVPLLSFEVMLANYNNEIDRAIPTLYLYYWMTRIDQTLQHKVQASEFAATQTEEDIDNNKTLLNSLILEIPVLQDEAYEVNRMIEELTVRIEFLQNQLLAKAKHSVKKKNRLKKIFGIGQTVANVLPVLAPVPVIGPIATTTSSVINTAISFAENIIELDKISATACDPNFFSTIDKELSKITGSVSSGTFFSTLTSSYKTLETTIKPLQENYDALKGILSKSSAPNSEVQAEYNKLIANSIEWKYMMGEVEELNAKKTDLLNRRTWIFPWHTP